MNSSLDDAILLLNKWRAESTPIFVTFCEGPPESPRNFALSFFGSVTNVDGLWIDVSNGGGCLRLEVSGGSFEYIQPSEQRLSLDVVERENAEKATEGCLFICWDNGRACLLCELREGTAFVRGED
jgi:hypothetical protein